jgi:hypothetical protein
MAIFTRKKLAFIQLPSSKGDLYDSGPAIGLVHNIIIHNTNSTAETYVIYLHDGTNEFILYNKELASDTTEVLSFIGEGLIVDAASKLTGLTTTAAKVTCLIMGSEES